MQHKMPKPEQKLKSVIYYSELQATHSVMVRIWCFETSRWRFSAMEAPRLYFQKFQKIADCG